MRSDRLTVYLDFELNCSHQGFVIWANSYGIDQQHLAHYLLLHVQFSVLFY